MNLTKHPTIIEAAQATGLDLNEPSVAAAIEAAEQVGIEQERDRACGLIQLGGETGAWKTAYAAIESGATMTPTLFTAFAQAGRAHIEIEAWAEDCDVVEEVLAGAKRPPSQYADPFEKQVADRLAELLDTSSADGRIEDLGQ